ncbi:MAG: hypothetical protein ACOX6T_19935 [Myxococcales bacterium]|jgi:hypothetical protein
MRKVFSAAALAGALVLAARVHAKPPADESARAGQPGTAQGSQPQAQVPQQQPAEPQFQISGEVERVSTENQVLRIRNTENNFVVPLTVEDRATIQMNGRSIALSEVPEGAAVRATYSIEGDRLVASQVIVSSRPRAGSGGAGVGGAGAGGEFSVRGRVAAVQSDGLRIFDQDAGYYVDLDVPRGAQVMMDGEKVEVGEIPEGAQVRATYRVIGDDLVARTIDASPRPTEPERSSEDEPADRREPAER